MLKHTLTCWLLLGIYGIATSQQIVLEPSKTYQEIVGFGASDAWRTQFVGAHWPLEKREQIADLLFSLEQDATGNPKGIGLSLWRFCIGAGSSEQGDSSDIGNEWRRSESYLNADGTYDWSKNQGQRWFLKAAQERGVDQFLAFSLSAPVHYTLNGKAYSIKGDERINLQPGHFDAYARYLTNVLQHFEQQEAVSFDYISPSNEPQWDWSNPGQEGTAATNEDLFVFIRYLSTSLAKSGLKTRIVFGESGHLDHLFRDYKSTGNQIPTFFDSASPLYIADLPSVEPIISGHSYFTTWPIDSLINTRRKLQASLAEYPNLNFWQTEFCILEDSPEIGNGHKRDLGMSTALYVARVIHADLTIANAASWQWWTALTTFDYKDGLIYLDTGDSSDLFNRDQMKVDGAFHESKLLWALGNYARFVRPGMDRIEATIEDLNSSTSVSAYKKGKDLVLVLTNHNERAAQLALPADFTMSAAYLTDERHDLTSVELGEPLIELPAKSLLTITGTINE